MGEVFICSLTGGNKVKKKLWYRIVVHNVSVTDELVRDVLRRELGRGVRMKSWLIEQTIHHEVAVFGGGVMPQREQIVVVEYEKSRSRKSVSLPRVVKLADVKSVADICGKIFPVTTAADCAAANVVYLEAPVPSKEHFHKETTEIYIFVGGEGVVYLDGERVRVRAGTVVAIPPGTRHYIVPDESFTFKLWVVASPAWRESDQFEV